MPPKPYGPLRNKMLITILCFALVPLLALGITIYYQFGKAYNAKIRESIRTLAENERISIELFAEERLTQFITVVNTHSLATLRDEDYLKRLFLVMQSRSNSYIDLSVIDEDGDHLAYVGPYYEKLKTVNYSKSDWFRNVMKHGTYISDVFMGFRELPHIVIAAARLEGAKTWILRSTINSDIIDKIVRKAQRGKSGDAFIVNTSNKLQTLPRFGGRKLFEEPVGPDFSDIRTTTVEEATENGAPMLYAATPITSLNWVLVVKRDPREELMPLLEARYVGILIVVGGIIMVVLGGMFVTHAMTGELVRVELEKRKSDDLVMQSSKMAALGKMAAGIAHEINNPLAIIGEKAGWMRDLLDKEDVAKSENWQEFEDCIIKIERQVERSSTITHRLLRFGRRMEPTQELVDVNTILAETITFLENEAVYREITIATDYEQRLPRINTDQAQLQQVFLNIINNGIDAVGRQGSIYVETHLVTGHPDEIRIDVQDTGPGMSKETLDRIFEPFYTTKSPNEGTGLGLSISYSIMEKLGGRITVKSEEGKGTTFSIFVPKK